MTPLAAAAALVVAHALLPAAAPLDLRLDASQAAAARPGPSIAAGLALSSPLANTVAFDVTAGLGRDCLLDVCVDPPKISTNASVAFALGPLDARVGATLESGALGASAAPSPALAPRIDASLALGFLAIETEGASTMRVSASFDF